MQLLVSREVAHRFGAIALERGGDEQEQGLASTGRAKIIRRVSGFIGELISEGRTSEIVAGVQHNANPRAGRR